MIWPTAPDDYTALNNVMLLFPEAMCINISINMNNENESAFETFFVILSSSDPAVVIEENVASVVIERRAPIGLERMAYAVDEGEDMLEVCVVSFGQLSRRVTVSFSSQDGTAIQGK